MSGFDDFRVVAGTVCNIPGPLHLQSEDLDAYGFNFTIDKEGMLCYDGSTTGLNDWVTPKILGENPRLQSIINGTFTQGIELYGDDDDEVWRTYYVWVENNKVMLVYEAGEVIYEAVPNAAKLYSERMYKSIADV